MLTKEKSEGIGGAVKNIVYITDEGYVFPTKVSILSIARNVRDARLAIYIVSVALSDKSRQVLQALETENIAIRILAVPQLPDVLHLNHAYISDAALLKSCLQSVLPDLDRALFVDGDTILGPGFLDIFDVDLTDVYVAAVMDMVRMRNDTWYKEFGLTGYFNSGVMYLNFTKMREDNIAERFISYFPRDDIPKTFGDQDVLNAAFGGKVLYLGLQYNCLTVYRSRFSTEDVLAFFQAKADDYESPAILHFASSAKPWQTLSAPDVDVWLEYVPVEDYPQLLQNYSAASKDQNVESLKQRVVSLNQKVESLKQRNASLNQQVESLKQRNASLNQQVESLKERNASLDQKVESLKERNASLNQKVASLDQKVASLDQKVGSLDQKVASLNEGLESRNASLVAKQERIDKLKTGIERRDVEIATLKGRIVGLGMTISENHSAIASQNNTIETLQSEKEVLQGIREELLGEKEELQGIREELLGEKEELLGELAACGKALDLKRTELQALEESTTYKVGLGVLAVPRMIRRLFKRT